MYNDDEKAILILSQECSLKKRMTLLQSVDTPSQLYDDLSAADIMIEKMRQYKIRAVTILSDDYPEQLKDIYDPPIALYCRGNIQLLKEKYLCAVVG
ncbi:MAG: DNA-processing protein DprA, partial [Clostridia bacterium]